MRRGISFAIPRVRGIGDSQRTFGMRQCDYTNSFSIRHTSERKRVQNADPDARGNGGANKFSSVQITHMSGKVFRNSNDLIRVRTRKISIIFLILLF